MVGSRAKSSSTPRQVPATKRDGVGDDSGLITLEKARVVSSNRGTDDLLVRAARVPRARPEVVPPKPSK